MHLSTGPSSSSPIRKHERSCRYPWLEVGMMKSIELFARYMYIFREEDFNSLGSLVALTCGAKEGEGDGFGTQPIAAK